MQQIWSARVVKNLSLSMDPIGAQFQIKVDSPSVFCWRILADMWNVPFLGTAKDFIAYLMKADPEARPSISQALAHPWVQQATAAISTTKARDIPQSVVVQEARSRSITRNMPTLSHQRPGDPLVRTVTAQIQASQQKQQSQ